MKNYGNSYIYVFYIRDMNKSNVKLCCHLYQGFPSKTWSQKTSGNLSNKMWELQAFRVKWLQKSSHRKNTFLFRCLMWKLVVIVLRRNIFHFFFAPDKYDFFFVLYSINFSCHCYTPSVTEEILSVTPVPPSISSKISFLSLTLNQIKEKWYDCQCNNLPPNLKWSGW